MELEGIESPIELVGRLIEESGDWTKDLVIFTRTIVVVFVILALFFAYSYSKSVIEFLSEDGPILPVILGIPIILLLIYAANYTYRNFRIQVRRRNKWNRRLQVLKKKEEEIANLLSEGAD